MSSPFSIIATAWRFYKKQPVLNEIAFWLFFAPIGIGDVILALIETASAQESLSLRIGSMPENSAAFSPEIFVVTVPLMLIVFFCMFWGNACVYVVAKRLVSSPAGRNRSSFKAVRKQASKYIGPLALTEVLRMIFTFLWTLLLIIPGIIYNTRTLFYGIMMIEDGKINYGRDALKRSTEIVEGRTWEVFLRMLGIGISIMLPAAIASEIIENSILALHSGLTTLALIATDLIEAFATVFLLVCTVALYADLKATKSSHPTPASPK